MQKQKRPLAETLALKEAKSAFKYLLSKSDYEQRRAPFIAAIVSYTPKWGSIVLSIN